MFNEDRQRVCIPNFLESEDAAVYLPLTNQIHGLLPKFMLRGSFATTWYSMCNTLSLTRKKVKVFLNAITGAIPQAERLLTRARKSATNMDCDTEHYQGNFAFSLLNHLLETSNNVVNWNPEMISWV